MAKSPNGGADAPAASASTGDAYVVALGTLTYGPAGKTRSLAVGDEVPAGAFDDDERASLVERGKIIRASDLPSATPSQALELQQLRDMVNAATARAEAAEAKLAPLQAELDALKKGAPAPSAAPAAPAK